MSTDLPVPETRVLAIASHVGTRRPAFAPTMLPADSAIEGRLWVSCSCCRVLDSTLSYQEMPDDKPDMSAILWRPSSCSHAAVKWPL